MPLRSSVVVAFVAAEEELGEDDRDLGALLVELARLSVTSVPVPSGCSR